ncbi:hypothetical protein HYX19_05310 [Candidatus Woesearchaeota archaeon]|nr:hypothetical protein [Candidatus Woesearchaeota archaeon]
MTINLTQNFEYETDSLKNFERTLKNIFKTVYEKNSNKHSRLFVSKRGEDFNFDDGSRWLNKKGLDPNETS